MFLSFIVYSTDNQLITHSIIESEDIYLRYIWGYNYLVFAEKMIYDVYISHFEKA